MPPDIDEHTQIARIYKLVQPVNLETAVERDG